MTVAPGPTIELQRRFAAALPELALPWQAAEAPAPRLLVLDEELAVELGLDPEWLRTPEGVRLLTGERVPTGATPVAQAYAGHQFGGFTPRLGDGRALLLGELVGADGRLVDLHLKGSGRTPFSRGGDGFAAVGPMLREHVLSVAMQALGIPSTRSLAVVATGRAVQRETLLPGAVLARVAASHLRVGSLQFARSTGDVALLRRLADHALHRHHPEAARAAQPHLALFEAVVTAQARLVAQWMLVGFVHGVMNTDNMTLSGETIDYGPCAFLEGYDPSTAFSSIDSTGRYAYANQPLAAEWNLARLAEAMLPLFSDDEQESVRLAVAVLEGFSAVYDRAFADGLQAKLGLADPPPQALADDLLALLQADRVDWTSFFRALAEAARGEREPVRRLFLDLAGIDAWLDRWRGLHPDGEAMDRVNPVYVPRNALVEQALAAGTAGDLAPLEELLSVLRTPFVPQPGRDRYAAPGPDGAGYVTYCGT